MTYCGITMSGEECRADAPSDEREPEPPAETVPPGGTGEAPQAEGTAVAETGEAPEPEADDADDADAAVVAPARHLDGPDTAGSTSGSPGAPKTARPRAVSAAITGALTLALGFGLTVQIRNTDVPHELVGARQDDLVRILDELNGREEQLQQQLAEKRQAVEELSSGQSQSGRALTEAQQRAAAIAVLNGTAPAHGPGLRITVQDPDGGVSPAVLLDAIEELRGAGAEAIQVDDVRVVVSSHVSGSPGEVSIDGHRLGSSYEIRAVGPPDQLNIALSVSGGVAADVARAGGKARIIQADEVVVDAVVGLRAAPRSSDGSGN